MEKEVYPIYIQSSNPSQELLNWIEKMREAGIVYLQTGAPQDPPNNPPGGGGGNLA